MDYKIHFARVDDLQNILEVYEEWESFKGILPYDLIKPATYDSMLNYFDGTNKSRKYLVAKTNNGDLLGVQLDFYGHYSSVKVSFVDPRITVILMPIRHITPKVD